MAADRLSQTLFYNPKDFISAHLSADFCFKRRNDGK
jgi:hypothetical protein